MSEKSSFLNWVGFKSEESTAPNSVDRIRELESQLADLRSRRDIKTLSKEEFEILATETAMTIIKSAQLREAKAVATSDRVLTETSRQAKDVIEGADQKAKSLLSSAETRGRKYIMAAEADAQELMEKAGLESDILVEEKKREAALLTTTAKREGERMISQASHEVTEYREWLTGVISEAERLYKIQTQSLEAAEAAIHQSRSRLDSAFARLAELQKNVIESINSDGSLVKNGPMKVSSERTKPALDAPVAENSPARRVVKKTASKRK